VAGRLDTGLVERRIGAPDGDPSTEISGNIRWALAAAALARVLAREPAGPVTDPWDIPDGWRPGERAWTRFRLSYGSSHGSSHGPGTTTAVRVRGLASTGAEVAVGDGDPVAARAEFRPAGADGTDLILSYDGRTVRFAYAADGSTTWLGRDGQAWAVHDEPPAPLRGTRAGAADGTVRAPMPGTILAVHVTPGDTVSTGQPVLVVEAMKMEHTVTAPLDGVIGELSAKVGQQVTMDEPLAVIGPEPGDGA